MAAVFKKAALASALLLLAAALGKPVSWRRCNTWARPLDPGRNNRATALLLQHCRIYKLDRTFEGFPHLEYIYLSGNHIEFLNLTVFKPVKNIKELSIDDNKLRELPVFSEYSLFPNMTHLYLQRNLITAISDPRTFSASVNLELIDLDNNLIEFLHPEVFKPLNSLRILSLYENRLRFISGSIFQIKSLEELSLHHNLIEYVSPQAFQGSKLERLTLNNNRITYLPVNFTSGLLNESHKGNGMFSHIQYKRFDNNPWHCGCFIEFLAEVRRVDEYDNYHFSPRHFNSFQHVCLFIGAFSCHRDVPSPLLSYPSGRDAARVH